MVQTSSLSGTERQEKILQILEAQQRISVLQICEIYGVSEATARRDLEALADQGRLQRVHGGAIPLRQAPPELPILQRSSEQKEEKKRIGKAAAELVRDADTIFLGSGSTVLALAEQLRNRNDLTVITNSLPVMNALAEAPGIQLISLGGMFRRSELSYIGHITEQALGEVRADKVFIGIHAIDLRHGLTNAYLPETMTDRAILKIGREIVVLADHTKIGSVSAAFLAPLQSIHRLVTNQETPIEFIAALQEQGIQVITT